jgi:hypothetical protein
MNNDFKNLVMFTAKIIISGLVVYLIIFSMFGSIFKSIDKVENLIVKADNIVSKLDTMYNNELSDMRFVIDGTIQNYEILYLLAKKQYENKNFNKSLYYLDLIKGIPHIQNNNMTKVLDLRRLVESKVN